MQKYGACIFCQLWLCIFAIIKIKSLNYEFFIAKKLKGDKGTKLSAPVVRISIVSIALGLSLMIISIAIVVGFKNSVSEKVIGFASHMKLISFDNIQGVQGNPIVLDNELISLLSKNKEIKHYQFVAQKAGVLKTNQQILGIVMLGVDENYDSRFLKESIVAGTFPDISHKEKTDEILISESTSKKLNLNINDPIRMWFTNEEGVGARGRKFIVSGIYNTGMDEIDNSFIVGDIDHLRKLNNWTGNEVGSIEIFLTNEDKIIDESFKLYNVLPYNIRVISVYEEYPQIFNWLELLDMNVIVILVLLIIVSTITMISTLLILIMERTSMVGLLKALGSTNRSIRAIFLYKASGIIIKGMMWGNFFGLLFYFLQSNYKLVSLSAESYYVDYVPVQLSLFAFLLVNLGTFVVSFIVLIIPVWYITRIVPSRALRYE